MQSPIWENIYLIKWSLILLVLETIRKEIKMDKESLIECLPAWYFDIFLQLYSIAVTLLSQAYRSEPPLKDVPDSQHHQLFWTIIS